MDILTKLLQNISLIGTLVAAIAFVVGLCGGFLIEWPFRRKLNKIFAEHLLSLQNEVEKVDAEVGKLWSNTFPRSVRASAPTINALAGDKETVMITNLENAQKVLHSLVENLTIIALNVEPRSKSKVNARVNQQDTYPYEPPKVRIHHALVQRQNLQENYEVEVESTTADAPDDMVQLYNLAVNDTIARERFREHFCPIRIGTINAVERRQNPTITAEIRETTDGDFFALPLGSNLFAVFPRLGLTIEAVSFGAGAVGEVFDRTKGHDPKLFYSNYHVKEPAVFELEGEHWLLRKTGELELGFGEP